MDHKQYSTLIEALSDVPDPRKARGKQYCWLLLLTLICSALASAERNPHGIASWVSEHASAFCSNCAQRVVACRANRPCGVR